MMAYDAYDDIEYIPNFSPFLKPIKPLLDTIHFIRHNRYGVYIHEFCLEEDDRTSIRESWSDSEKAYNKKVILCFAQINPEENTNQHLPYQLAVTVNNKKCKLPTLNPSERELSPKLWRKNVPIDITKQSLSNKNSYCNSIEIAWKKDPQEYIASVYLVEKLTPDKLLIKVKEKPPRKYKITKEMIKNSMKSDIGMDIHSMSTTLQDPLSKTRIKLPVRGVHCKHLQCFDALQFLELNNQKETWACPLCRIVVKLEDIEVDEFFLHILQSPNLSKECENVILSKDGSWCEKKREFSNSSSSNSSSNKNIPEITLADSDTDDDTSNLMLHPLQSKTEHIAKSSNHSIVNPIHPFGKKQKEIIVITLD